MNEQQTDFNDSPSTSPPPPPNAPSIPDFRILSKLGSGSYGDVWLAENLTHSRCAIKIVYQDRFADVSPYQREFQGICNSLEISRTIDPLVTIYHVGRNKHSDFFYYSMELADADPNFPLPPNSDALVPYTLRSLIDSSERPSIDRVIKIGQRILTGLGHLHLKGYVHRDIKPSNIVFIDDHPKIADIGLVTSAKEQDQGMGTNGYTPKHGAGTPGADLYALGKVLYELATGCDRLEFPKLPEELEALANDKQFKALNSILLKACDERSEARYVTAREMFDDISTIRETDEAPKGSSTRWWDALWENSGPPEPSEEQRLESATGAVPLDSRLYVFRTADIDLETAIDRNDAIMLIKGARQMGKSSLLARGLQLARSQDYRVVLSDLQSLSTSDFNSATTFYQALGDDLADQLDLKCSLSELWTDQRSPNKNFERFLRRNVLESEQPPLFWGRDEVDRLFSVPFGTEIFSLLRACYNKRALDPDGPWQRFSVAITYASEAQLFITDVNQSPFNVGTRILLADFDRTQVDELNRRHSRPLKSEADLDQFYAYFGGQPYLCRQALYEIVTKGYSLDELFAVSERNDGPFSEHLKRLTGRIQSIGTLDSSLHLVLDGKPITKTDDFYALRSLGVLTGASVQEAAPRCELYRSFLKNQTP